jgi:hypothetical protein
MRRSKLLFTILALSLFILPASVHAAAVPASVHLRWNTNTESDFSYYNVYYGTVSRNYGNPIPAGKQTSRMIDGLETGKTYYFAVTAVDTSGNESGFSTEVSANAISSEPATSAYELLFSTNSNRSGGIPLDNQTVAKDIFVFVQPEDYITSVAFSIDGKAVRTERYAPYDLMSGPSNKANPLDTQTLSNGAHTISAKVVLQDNSTLEIDATINVANITANIAPDKNSPQAKGTSVTFTGSATGGTGQFEHHFRLKDMATNNVTVVQDYSADKTWTWNTANYKQGDYLVSVWVRNSGSNSQWDAWDQIPFEITANSVQPQPLEAVVTPDVTTPQIKGQNVTFTGSATGGSGTYEYLFRLKDVTKNRATTVQSHSPKTTWTWNTGIYDTGDYKISVWVRNAGSQADWEAWDQIPYELK